MNISLSTFMKLAVTSIVIIALLWNLLVPQMDEIASKITTYIANSNQEE